MKNGELIFNDSQNGFITAVQKVDIEGKSAILIKDLGQTGEYYIAYDGAVTKLNNSSQLFCKPLFEFIKYSSLQGCIYARAAKNFPFKIVDNHSECIIGKGIPKFGIKPLELVGANKTDQHFLSYYQQVLKTL